MSDECLLLRGFGNCWIDDIGSNLPTPEQMLQHLLALTPVTECHIDGYYPLGTDHCVMVVKDEHDRILMTHEVASEHGDDARQFLQRLKDRGLKVTAAFSDYSQSFTEAIKAVFPHARFQADHFHTVKNIWGHLKQSLLSYRRKIKAKGEEKADENVIEQAKTLWKLRWSLLKKPGNLGRVPIFPVRLRAEPGVKWPYVSTSSTAPPCSTSARARWPRHWHDTSTCSALSSAG
jgi:Transposase